MVSCQVTGKPLEFDAAGGFASGNTHNQELPLFRPEALAAATSGIGRPIAALPLSWALIGGLLGTMLIGFVIFLSVGTFSRKETANGIVRAVGGDIRIEAPAPGIASTVMVTEGQRIRAGETLLIVGTPRNDAGGRPLNEAMIDSLERDLAGLETRMDSLQAGAAVERSGAFSRLAALQGELTAARAQEVTAAQRLTLADEALTRLAPVAEKGFISGDAVRRRREEVLMLRQAVADARGIQSRIAGQISEVQTSEARRPLVLLEERGQLQDAIARLRRERDSYVGQRGYSIKAPADGIITALQVSDGQTVAPQRPLMTLSRPGTAILAEIFVPSRAIGFLEPDQEVKVRYDAFPAQRFGVATGKVRSISSTVLRPEEVQSAVKVDEPVFRVLIELDDAHVRAYGKAYRIRPGLAVSASIILDRRTFAEWLLDPIIALRGRL